MINFGRLPNKTENKYMYIIYIFNEPVRNYIRSTISVDLNVGNLTKSGIVIYNFKKNVDVEKIQQLTTK